ncbi:TRAP transporter small permease [Arenibaculum pallidiluteum]|uniref:TRAP transporter small permease n=1 Tax=Arenibaculum pallidiluteum TaxID=2812559 RepID=UPI001A96B481|nr:TRAP transporter small permease [Arenibaculum pallidiluteum]
MERLIHWTFKGLEMVLVGLLAGMVVMVFGNVVLRYLFNSGIDVSEELSRYFFVWLTFIGAIVAMREGAHLGVDTLVRVLGRSGRLVCLVLSDLLILLCCAVLAHGTWVQFAINASNYSPVTGLPMVWVFGIGLVTSAAIGLMVAARLVRTLTGRMTDAELEAFAGIQSDEERARAAAEGRIVE